MRIPPKFATYLSKDKSLEAAVFGSIDELEPWIVAGGKRPTFFPDYTDHSIQHIEEVLNAAADLIRVEAWRAITPGDVAVLISAVILHDSAMHLTREGFESLVQPTAKPCVVSDFRDPPWPTLWSGFIAEAKRFDQITLVNLFGDALPAPIPDVDNLVLDDRTRRLIGEFIRRHHPRLAHEIGVFGVPGTSSHRLALKLPGELGDLAGVVARSHGHSIREMMPYLKKQFHNRVAPAGIHAVFLMVLLRVADFLQIQASRAPQRVLLVHRIRSPFSAVEWSVHAAIRDVRESEEDSETVFVRAYPQDVTTFLRIRTWLSGLQRELDDSWAVLGEVFSRQDPLLRQLGIKLRRVASNLDDYSIAERSLSFVPEHVVFSTAGPKVLRLLIGPLYGERPQIGIRELLQNSVDSVRERQELQRMGLLPQDVQFSNIDGEVEMVLETDSEGAVFTIRDCGTGMTPEMISSYFLRAGASFRDSQIWKRSFLDDEGRSLVMRSGRFGVGALAAFLLGDEVEVTTRHYTFPANRAVYFRASVDTDPIELSWCEREVGTTISVRVSAENWEKLSRGKQFSLDGWRDPWDWYCLDTPKVIRRLQPDNRVVKQQYNVPGPGAELDSEWHRVSVTPYVDVLWTYSRAPAFSCNGIIVQAEKSPFGSRVLQESWLDVGIQYDHFLPRLNKLPVRPPSVAIYDQDGFLPLDLRREWLTHIPDSLAQALVRDIYDDFFRKARECVPPHPFFESGDASWPLGRTYIGRTSVGGNARPVWGWTENGYVLLDGYTCWKANVDGVVFYPVFADEIQRNSLPVATARLVNETDSLLAIPIAVERSTEESIDEETVFGNSKRSADIRAFIEIVSDFVNEKMTRATAAILESYYIHEIMIYTHARAQYDLEALFENADIDLGRYFRRDGVCADQFVIQLLRNIQEKADILKPGSFQPPNERGGPLIELHVRRIEKAPKRGMLRHAWEAVAGSRSVFLSEPAD